MWNNTISKLTDLFNVFYCYKCQIKLQHEFIFGCKHALYCRDCYSVEGLKCKLNINCEISQLKRFQTVLNLCESLHLLIKQDHSEILAVSDHETKDSNQNISSLIQDSTKSTRKCKSLYKKDASQYFGCSTPKNIIKLTPKKSPKLNTSIKKVTHLRTPRSVPIAPKLQTTGKKQPIFTPRREYSARKSWTGKLSDLKSASPKQLYSRNMKGETLLHVACIKGEMATVKKLLETNFDPNIKDFANWTPLHEASNHGYADICELLIRFGALVDVCGDENCTPLHDAIINSRLQCVKILLENGASINQRNSNGLTAMDLVTTDDVKEILKLHSLNVDKNKNNVNLGLVNIEEPMMPYEIVITTSGFDEDTYKEIAKAASKLGWKFTSTFVNEVTHVIAKLSDFKTCKRTMKTMSAILLGRWIVSEQWIKCSLKKLNWVEENKFLIKYCGSNRSDKAPSKSRLAYKQQLPQLFNGCNFFVSHNIETNLKDNLIYLIKLGGGLIIHREPRIDSLREAIYDTTVPFHAHEDSKLRNCSYFVVSPDSDFSLKSAKHVNQIVFLSEQLCRVNATWIFDCISKYTLIDELS